MVQGPDGSPEFHLLESIYKTAVKLSYGVDIADGEDDVLILASTVVIDMVCHGDNKRR